MAKNNPWIKYIVILVVAITLLAFQQIKTNKYSQKSEKIFKIKAEDINEITVSKDTNSVTLMKDDDKWFFAYPDTGSVNEQKILSFLENVIDKGKTTDFQTKNPNNYAKYSVTENLGTHLLLKDTKSNTINVIFGQSKSTWAHDYIKLPNDPKVYITSKKIIYLLSEKANFWR